VRVMASISKFLASRMRLQVNAEKSAVRHPSKVQLAKLARPYCTRRSRRSAILRCRSGQLSLDWTLGVAYGGTLTRLNQPAQEFTRVRCCGSPRTSSPHGLAAPASRVSRRTMLRAVASGSRLLPTRPVNTAHFLVGLACILLLGIPSRRTRA
jgi:hypothetical protein